MRVETLLIKRPFYQSSIYNHDEKKIIDGKNLNLNKQIIKGIDKFENNFNYFKQHKPDLTLSAAEANDDAKLQLSSPARLRKIEISNKNT